MPWWAYLYLALFLLLTIGGISDDMRRPNKIVFISGEVISTIFVILFVSAYFHAELAQILGVSVFAMVGVGAVYELVAAQRVILEHEKNPDADLTPRENATLNNISLILGNIFVVPGYVFGLMTGLRSAGFP